MAIPSVVGVGTAAGGTGDVVPGLPSGWQANDIHLMIVSQSAVNDFGAFTPSGWTLVAQTEVGANAATDACASLYWRRAQAGDTDPTVPDTGNHTHARIIGIRGCPTSGDPWSLTPAASTDATANTSVSISGQTTGHNDCLILYFVSTGVDQDSTTEVSSWADSNLSSVTEWMDNWNSAGNGSGFSCMTGGLATAGATGTATATLVNSANKVHFVVSLKPGGLSATVNQNTETDTTQAVSKIKQKAIGQNSATNTAQAINRSKSKAVGINSETDAAQVVAWSPKHRLVGQNVETDSAQVISWSPKNRLVALNTETDSVQAISARKIKTVAQISETDLTQTITRVKSKAIGQSSETDTVQVITRVKRVTVNQVTETDLAQPITEGGGGQIIVPVNQVSEIDTSQSISADKIKTIGQNSETDAAQSITRVKRALISQVSETDLTQALFPLKRVSVVQVVETDLSQAITADKVKQIGQVSEADSAQTIAWSPKKRLVNQVAETDMAQSIIVPDTITLFTLTLYPRDISLDLFARSRGLSLDERIELFTVKEEV